MEEKNLLEKEKCEESMEEKSQENECEEQDETEESSKNYNEPTEGFDANPEELKKALDIQEVEYEKEEGKITIKIKNTYTEDIKIERIAIYMEEDTPNEKAQAIIIQNNLESQQTKEYILNLDGEKIKDYINSETPYMLRIMTDTVHTIKDITLSDWI